MGDVYLTKFEFVASGMSKVTSQFTGMASGMKAKAAAAGAAIGKALTSPIAAAMATMATGMGIVGVTKEFMNFESASSAAVARLGLNVSRTAEQIRADLKAGLDVTIDESKYVKALDNVQSIQRELGATTAFTATEVGQGIENIAAMGADVLNLTAEGYKPFLDLSSATSYGLAETSDQVMSTLRAFGLYDAQLTNSARVTDVYAKACGMSALDMTKISNAMNYIGPVAAQYGINLEEVTAQMALLANAGYDGSMSGTALRGAYMRLTSPTKEATDLLKSAGVTLDQVNPRYNHMTDILKTLGEAFHLNNAPIDEAIKHYEKLSEAGMEEEEIVEEMKKSYGDIGAIFEIFGARAAPAMLAMMNQMEDFETFYDNLVNSAGASSTMAAQKLDNLKGAIIILKSALSDLAIELGSYLAPGLRRFAEWLTSTGIPAIKSFFQALHSGDFQSAGQKITELGKWILEGLINIISSIDWLGLFTGLITFIASLPRLIWEQLSQLANYINDGISNINIKDSIQKLTDGFSGMGETISNNVKAELQALKNIGSLIITFIKTGLETSVELGSAIYNAFMSTDFAKLGYDIAYKIGQSLLLATKQIKDVGKFIADSILKVNWRSIGKTLSDNFNKLSDSVGGGKLSQKFQEIFRDVPKAVGKIDWENVTDRMLDDLTSALTSIKDAVSTAISEVLIGAYGEAIGKVKFEELTEKFNKIKEDIIKAVEAIKTPFENTFNTLKDKAKQAIDDIKNAFGPAFQEIQKTVDTIKNALSSMFDENNSKANEWISIISQIIAKFVEWGGSAVIGAVKIGLEGIAKILETVFKVINDYILPALGWLYDELVIIKDMFWLWAGDFITACWEVAKNASSFKEGIVNIFKLIVAYIIAEVETLEDEMVNKFKEAFNTVVIHAFLFQDDVVAAFNGLYTALQSPIESIKSLISGISTTISNVLGDVTNLGTAVEDVLGIGKNYYTFYTKRSDTKTGTHFLTEKEADALAEEKNWYYEIDPKYMPGYVANVANQVPVLRTVVPGQDTTTVTSDSGQEILVEVEPSSVEKAVGEGFANAFTGGAYSIGKGLTGWLTGQTINTKAVESNTKTLEDFVKNLPADATGEIGVFEDGAAIIADAISNAPPDKTLKVASVETAASSESTAASSSDTAQYTKQTAVSVSDLVDKYGVSEELAKQAIESGRIDEVIPHLKELNRDTFADRLEYWKNYFGLNEDESLEIQEDTLTITDKNGKTLIELEGLTGKTNEELEAIRQELEEERKEESETSKNTETNTGETAANTEEMAKSKAEADKESYEKTMEGLPDKMFYPSFTGNTLEYIKQVKEWAAIGMASQAQINHAANQAEKIKQDLMLAYEKFGTIPNEYVANIVGLDTSQLGPIPIETVAESVDVPKTETVDVKADATITGESKDLLAQEIESVNSTIIANTNVDGQSLAETVGSIEAQKPNVGVYLYIAQNITIPKTVSIGVNFYALNSPTANVPSSTDASLQKFDTGGYTGRYSGPAWVDPEEVILNKAQQLGVIKSLTGNINGSGEVHLHFHYDNPLITGFKDVDDFISYNTDMAIKEINRRQGKI